MTDTPQWILFFSIAAASAAAAGWTLWSWGAHLRRAGREDRAMLDDMLRPAASREAMDAAVARVRARAARLADAPVQGAVTDSLKPAAAGAVRRRARDAGRKPEPAHAF